MERKIESSITIVNGYVGPVAFLAKDGTSLLPATLVAVVFDEIDAAVNFVDGPATCFMS
ncbi:MAG: hypothetical protein HYY30_03590 [Chloroflexi bacterium]|nr:hypothetical protein [Chloroflexota bacterium]